MKPRALITGITGQDGSYLAEQLLAEGYEVHGVLRRSSAFNTGRIEHLYMDDLVRDIRLRKVNLHYGDLCDGASLIRLVGEIRPDEIYNLGAMSHVKVSFELPEYTADVDGLGTLRLLEAVRILGLTRSVRFYQASTSEVFGECGDAPLNEDSPFRPRSPYGAAKAYAHWVVKGYREAYGMFASNGILFNHESERRGETFVTRKISMAAANLAHGRQDRLVLGNLDAVRDWGYAPDFVRCMRLIVRHGRPDDFVIATGVARSVRDFCALAFRRAGFDLAWVGSGAAERGVDRASGRELVSLDPRYLRPAEVHRLLGDPAKAVRELGWDPASTSFEQLVHRMVDHDMARVAGQSGR
ncbi:MAG: GDP-mannose 4,6-dehydratase [Verrucomicrobiota bacterium]